MLDSTGSTFWLFRCPQVNKILPKSAASLHYKFLNSPASMCLQSRDAFSSCVELNILVLYLQPVAWTWTWRRFSLRFTRSRLRTLAPPLTPRCLPRSPLRCLPAFLITPRRTSSACRASAATTPTPFPLWPPRVPGQTPPLCRNCRASVSSSKRSSARGSLAR